MLRVAGLTDSVNRVINRDALWSRQLGIPTVFRLENSRMWVRFQVDPLNEPSEVTSSSPCAEAQERVSILAPFLLNKTLAGMGRLIKRMTPETALCINYYLADEQQAEYEAATEVIREQLAQEKAAAVAEESTAPLSEIFYDRINNIEEIEELRQNVLSETNERFLTIKHIKNNKMMHWFRFPDLSFRQDNVKQMYMNSRRLLPI